jgi:hypothetical protein
MKRTQNARTWENTSSIQTLNSPEHKNYSCQLEERKF